MKIKGIKKTPTQRCRLVMCTRDWRHFHVVWQRLAYGLGKSQHLGHGKRRLNVWRLPLKGCEQWDPRAPEFQPQTARKYSSH